MPRIHVKQTNKQTKNNWNEAAFGLCLKFSTKVESDIPLEPMAGQPGLLGELQTNERLCLKKRKQEGCRCLLRSNSQCCPLGSCAYAHTLMPHTPCATLHRHTQTHTSTTTTTTSRSKKWKRRKGRKENQQKPGKIGTEASATQLSGPTGQVPWE